MWWNCSVFEGMDVSDDWAWRVCWLTEMYLDTEVLSAAEADYDCS